MVMELVGRLLGPNVGGTKDSAEPHKIASLV